MLGEVCCLARLITSTRVYLQGRASEISLRCNDTKQVRDVSASQRATAHLPWLSLFLTESYTSLCRLTIRSAITWADSKHDYEILPFSTSEAFSTVPSTPIMFLSLELKSFPARALGAEKTLCCFSPVSTLSAQPCRQGTQMAKWPCMHLQSQSVSIGQCECGYKWVCSCPRPAFTSSSLDGR